MTLEQLVNPGVEPQASYEAARHESLARRADRVTETMLLLHRPVRPSGVREKHLAHAAASLLDSSQDIGAAASLLRWQLIAHEYEEHVPQTASIVHDLHASNILHEELGHVVRAPGREAKLAQLRMVVRSLLEHIHDKRGGA
jgi:hypothetical protein